MPYDIKFKLLLTATIKLHVALLAALTISSAIAKTPTWVAVENSSPHFILHIPEEWRSLRPSQESTEKLVAFSADGRFSCSVRASLDSRLKGISNAEYQQTVFPNGDVSGLLGEMKRQYPVRLVNQGMLTISKSRSNYVEVSTGDLTLLMSQLFASGTLFSITCGGPSGIFNDNRPTLMKIFSDFKGRF